MKNQVRSIVLAVLGVVVMATVSSAQTSTHRQPVPQQVVAPQYYFGMSISPLQSRPGVGQVSRISQVFPAIIRCLEPKTKLTR